MPAAKAAVPAIDARRDSVNERREGMDFCPPHYIVY